MIYYAMINNLFERFLLMLNQKYKFILFVFFSLVLVIGLLVYDQYGLSWDEGMQWKYNGCVNYNFIVNGDKESLLASGDKYHGPAFELTLVAIEKLFHLTDTRSVYLMRHLVNFLVFYLSLIVFYLLVIRLFNNWKFALAGCLMLVLSPRIFAEAFYNSKDLVLLSFFIFSFYTMLVFHERQTIKTALLHALVCAYAIDIRITAVVLPMLSVAYLIMQYIGKLLYKNDPNISAKCFLIYFISLPVFIIFFWPVLWLGTVHHFIQAFKEMSFYQWDSYVLYFGNYIEATKLPWHYLPVWIIISTPVLYTVLFIVGILRLVSNLFMNRGDFLTKYKNEILIVLWLFIPILAVIILHSVVYDAWRHVYFVYGAFLLISLHGLQALFIWGRKLKYGKLLLSSLLVFSFLATLISMIKMHPYQNVYFSVVAGNDRQKIKNNFEMDYWGLSSRAALEYILTHDTANMITVLAPHTPGVLNAQIIPYEQRKRLSFTIKFQNADYYLGDYRAHNYNYPFKNEVFNVKTGEAKIVSVFKLQKDEKIDKPASKQ